MDHEDQGVPPMGCFTGEYHEVLQNVLQDMAESPLPSELFDAFLHEYATSGDVMKARFFAACEWDC